jgi:hypothetical protein
VTPIIHVVFLAAILLSIEAIVYLTPSPPGDWIGRLAGDWYPGGSETHEQPNVGGIVGQTP